ncbi:alpha/beta fold hydrolase [Streptomyces physcomitrii]|uniref:Alpha/beta fold hydrolase n=1 Tax=Streptomyces physcomitrii TaxID=2724184 RepID=A0ABX1GYY7_9ACTN|nr:alpha/beta fold hydrolase [Streptomyces physcomitrii]NKI41002.1 alpha/beta fold hydrolase [Streptomyces physcomitrii]
MAPLLAYEDEGAGQALVLVHGHPFDRSMWAPQRAAFAATHRVLTPDLRGYGDSPVTPGAVRLSTFAEDIRALLDELGVRRFVLAGLSMGGQIAMECLRRFGDRIDGLVLADTSPEAESPAGRAARHRAADRLLREGMRGYADEVLYRMVAPGAEEAVAAHVHRMMCSADPVGAAAALRGRAERPDYRELLARTAVPVLVVVGREDGFTPLAGARALHAAVPGSALTVVEGAAHLPNLERPEAFNAALAEFLDRLPAGTGAGTGA